VQDLFESYSFMAMQAVFTKRFAVVSDNTENGFVRNI